MADEIPDFLSVPNVPGGRVAMAGLSPDMQQSLLTKYGTPSFGAGPAEPLPRVDGGAVYPSPSGPPTSPAVTTAIQDAQSAGFKLPDPTPALNGNPSSYDWSKLSGPDKTFLMTRMGYNNPPDAPTSIGAPAAAMAPQPTSPVVPNPPGGPSGGPMGAAVQASMGTMPQPSGYAVPGSSLSPKDFAEVTKSQQQGIESGIRASNERAAFEDQEAKRIQQEQVQDAAKQQEHKSFFEDQTKQVNDINDKIAQSSAKVDPNHFWADKSTGQKMLAGFAVLLSGLGNGLMGKAGNPALDLIQKNIDRDIDLQKEANADKKDALRSQLTGKMNLIQLTRQQWGDNATSTLVARGLAREMAARTADGMAARAAGEQDKARLTGAAASLRIEASKMIDAAKDRAFTQHLQQQQADAASMHGEAALMDAGARAAQGAKGTKISGETAAGIGSTQGAIKTLDSLEDAFKKNTDWKSIVSQFIPGSKSTSFDDQRKAVAATLGKELGARDNPQIAEMIDNLLPKSPTYMGRGLNQISQLRNILQTKRDSQLQGLASAGEDVSGFAKSTAQKRDMYGAIEH